MRPDDLEYRKHAMRDASPFHPPWEQMRTAAEDPPLLRRSSRRRVESKAFAVAAV